MKNNKILGVLNLVVGLILTVPLVIVFVNSGQVPILGLFIIPLFDLIRGAMMMKGDYKVEDNDSEIFLSLLPMLWSIVLVYFFFAARISYLWYMVLAFPAILLVILKKRNPKMAWWASGLTLIIMLLGLVGGLEESYCWWQGERLGEVKNQISEEVISDEERKALGLGPIDKPAKGYLQHMRCHQKYNLGEAIMAVVSGNLN